MANRRLESLDVHELVRLKRAGVTNAEIGRLLGCSRQTVVKYVKWAEAEGYLAEAMPEPSAVLARLDTTMPEREAPQQVSSLARLEEEVRDLRSRGMEIAAIRVRLEERHGRPVSYEALRRLVRRIEPRPVPEAFGRIEVEPGQEAQVDFGYAGLTLDPETGHARKTWVFVMLLSWSRHVYAQLVYDQTVATWLDCHRRAFAFFGGVPERIVLDNLKAAIVKACRENPEVQRAYRECAEHYGFLIDPNPPARPHLKGKVEKGGVHYVKRNFLAGRDPEPTDALNQKLLDWCTQTAGTRVHGTTQAVPLERYLGVEQAALRPLPREPYDLAIWKQARLQRDCHVCFERAWYSAPSRLVGESLWVRGATRTVKIYSPEHELVAVHDRAEPGLWRSVPEHLPPQKVAGLSLNRAACRERAAALGPATSTVVGTLLEHRPVDKLRVAGRLLALAEAEGAERLERACALALAHGEGDPATVKAILRGRLDEVPQAEPPKRSRLYAFARTMGEYVAALAGAALVTGPAKLSPDIARPGGPSPQPVAELADSRPQPAGGAP